MVVGGIVVVEVAVELAGFQAQGKARYLGMAVVAVGAAGVAVQLVAGAACGQVYGYGFAFPAGYQVGVGLVAVPAVGIAFPAAVGAYQ